MNQLLVMIASSAALAAYSVNRQAETILNPLALGIAEAVAVITAMLYGEENRAMIRRLLYTYVRAVIVLVTGVSLLVLLLAPQLASLYVSRHDPAYVLAVWAIRFYAVGLPLYALNVTYENYFQGSSRSRLASVSGFLLEMRFCYCPHV